MKTNGIENNQVKISGKLVSDFEFSHEVFGEGFYVARLAVERTSEVKDVLPIMVSERLIDVKEGWVGHFIKVEGQFRSYNKHKENKSQLVLSVFVREFEELEEMPFTDDENNIFLDGYICKRPIYRETPLGREIADVLLAVNRKYGKSDYIPCITWGRNARFAENLEVGTRIQVWGRIQSREYQKKISDDESEKRIAYEVSVQKLEVGTYEQSED